MNIVNEGENGDRKEDRLRRNKKKSLEKQYNGRRNSISK